MRKWLLIGGLLVAVVVVGLLVYNSLAEGPVAGVVSLDQLPAGYLDIAKKELPQVKFDTVWRLKNGNYEIRGKDARGKAREVELNAKGTVVEVD
jgi:hypothetical protein